MGKDFIGFSFDGVHSSYLGLQRVSDGNFYSETLQPEFENKLKAIPGMDGQFYFGADYTSKPIQFKIAFDSVTEKQFRQITALFSTKKICSLILDERPYKMYKVRLTSPISLNYVCFDEPLRVVDQKGREGIRVIERKEVPVEPGSEETKIDITREWVYPYIYKYENGKIVTERIYKGEGEIEFICVSPMARAPFKTLDDYRLSRLSYDVLTEAVDTNFMTTYDNVDEWAESSGILTREQFNSYNIDKSILADTELQELYNIQINVYNPGDKDTPYILYLPYYQGYLASHGEFKPKVGSKVKLYTNTFETMSIAPFTSLLPLTEETGVLINSENHLIEGVYFNEGTNQFERTGNLYNNYIAAGDFGVITKQDIFENIKNGFQLGKQNIGINYTADPENVRIKYNYLYY